MTILRRKFTNEQKLMILKQAEEAGITTVLRIHRLSYSAFARWRQQLGQASARSEEPSLNHQERNQLKQIKTENQTLKKIIADQALQLEKKDEELKRKSSHGHGKK